MKVTLDKIHQISMLGDPDFYQDCPIFLFLRPAGLAAYAAYKEKVASGDCGDCRNDSVILPLLITFVRHVVSVYELDPKHLQCVKDYLSKRKGYEVHEAVVTYAGTGPKPTRLVF